MKPDMKLNIKRPKAIILKRISFYTYPSLFDEVGEREEQVADTKRNREQN